MRGAQGTADRAVSLARAHLDWKEPASRVHDVQGDPRFQHRGVDLLWESAAGVVGIEVKGDRNGSRDNYFLELVSNVEKDTPGCFLYSEADLYLYVFVREREVHEIPLRAARAWFLAHAREFPVRKTQTRVGADHYTTLGALVPVEELLPAVPGARRFRLDQAAGFAEVKPPNARSAATRPPRPPRSR